MKTKKSIFTRDEKLLIYFAVTAYIKQIRKLQSLKKRVSEMKNLPAGLSINTFDVIGWTIDDETHLKSALRKINKL